MPSLQVAVLKALLLLGSLAAAAAGLHASPLYGVQDFDQLSSDHLLKLFNRNQMNAS